MKRKTLSYLTILLLLSAFISCGQGNADVDGILDISLRAENVSYSQGSTFVKVSAKSDWTLSLEFSGTEEEWAVLDVMSGSGNKGNVILNYHANLEEKARTLTVTVTSGRNSKSCTLRQDAYSKTEEENKGTETSSKSAGWLELPAMPDDGRDFISHEMTVASKKCRNYSFYWDYDNLVASWVAYPLNPGLIGSGSRTDEWGLDPKLPADKQPVLYKGFSDGYQRGHQLPSADRLTRAANVTTFYGTNMTPQLGALNEHQWASLEGKVREWSRLVDTLYVVTGCVVRDSKGKAYDNVGKAVTVPSGYYKALLAYSRNQKTGQTTGGYSAVAFYYDHGSRSTSDYPSWNSSKVMMSVDELETKVGEDFFVNLKTKLGETLYNKVESSIDTNFWK